MVTKDKKIWEIAMNESGEEFAIMSESEYRREVYRLYKMQNGEWVKTSQSEDPSTFDELIFGGQSV